MIDYKTPLNDEQIALLSKLRAGLFHNKETGQTFIMKAYWNGITQEHRIALAKALS